MRTFKWNITVVIMSFFQSWLILHIVALDFIKNVEYPRIHNSWTGMWELEWPMLAWLGIFSLLGFLMLSFHSWVTREQDAQQ